MDSHSPRRPDEVGAPEAPASMRAASSLSSRRTWALVLLFVVLGFGLRVVIQQREWTLATDSFQYLLIAKSLAAGEGFVSGGGQFPDLTRSPVLPLLVAGFSFVTSTVEAAGDLVVALAGALLAVPLFFLTRRLFGDRAAVASLPLGALSTMTLAAARVLPTSLFVLFSVAAAWAAWECTLSRRWRVAIAAGVLAGVAALTRAEGLAWPPVLAVWVAFASTTEESSGRGSRAARATILLIAATAVYAPYVAWTSTILGRFAPAPGIEYLRDMRTLSDTLGLRYVPGSDLDWTERARFTMTRAGDGVILDAYFHDKVLPEVAPGNLGTVVDVAPDYLATRRALIERRLRIAWGNLVRVPRILFWTHLLTPAYLFLGVLGCVAALRSRATRPAAVLLALAGGASLVPVLSHIEGRLLYPLFAFAIVACAHGWAVLDRFLPGATRRQAVARAAIHGVILLSVFWNGVAHKVGGDNPDREPLLKAYARSCAPELPPGAVLAVHPNFPYLVGRRYVALPLGSPEDILEFARATGARSLVLEGQRDLARRPDLEPLFDDPPPPGFRAIATAPHPSSRELRVFVLEGAGPSAATNR